MRTEGGELDSGQLQATVIAALWDMDPRLIELLSALMPVLPDDRTSSISNEQTAVQK